MDPESIRGVDQTGLAFASAGHAGAQVDKWQTIEGFGLHKAFSLDFCSAVMMRVDEEDSVDSVADEGGDDDDDGDEGQDDDEDDDEEKEGDDECDGDEPQRSRRFR